MIQHKTGRRRRRRTKATTGLKINFEFPPEIEDTIFEWAARMNPRHAPILSITSKRIQACVERVIYESLLVSPCDSEHPEFAKDDKIYSTLSSRPAEFFAVRVKNLFIAHDVPPDIKAITLSKCTAVQHLVLYQEHMEKGSGKMVTSASTLSSLYTSKPILFEMVECGIKLPNLLFLGVSPQVGPHIPPLDGMPMLRTVQMNLGKRPGNKPEPWYKDVKTVFSTTAQLKALWLDVHSVSLDNLVRHLEIQKIDTSRIVIRDLDDRSDVFEEWRARIKDGGMPC
ncbi:hypothetical protein DXG01_015301 [Tephrocybe rancida]|nr:hypothetical protein DXG01_015301 [Tephrocybe rancida]